MLFSNRRLLYFVYFLSLFKLETLLADMCKIKKIIFLLHFKIIMLTSTIMKPHKLAILFSAVTASLLMSACSSTNDTASNNGFNCLGIVKYEPASFAPSSEYSAVIRTEDLFGMGLPSGDRTSFLWDAVVIQDY